ncbi:uncharacterized protein AC631_00229 [Debaryomyces fabryi]|uniref:Uncharacterized protein n=1 Tax=Debaryomyces fabryi TaxID=58627 RepID=A0A0V1Q667_9ASCO|nr:uncharacterized protein AC631_00229 [Debaryomyces fabryi]KSA03959.1 hypothetical protein AC631_00229 [Debaryomyces fabryi]CUM53859.1 unnamed protein product [Debaryomyces fabryi]
MSSDKDKRSSKLFGSRISSIFNVQPGHNVKHGNLDNNGSSTLRHAQTKPLSHPPLHNNSGRSTLDPHRLAPSVHVPPQSHAPVNLAPIKSPPRRKPPPPMAEEFDRGPDRNFAVEPPVNKISANRYGEEVKEDLNNIIGTLEKEIGSMLVNNEPMTQMDPNDHIHNADDQASITPGLNVSNALEVSRSNQSGPSYYSDSHSYNDSHKSSSISRSNQSGPSYFSDTRSYNESQKSSSISCNTDTQEQSLDEASATPSDTPEYNHEHEGGQVPYPIDSLPESPTLESSVVGLDLALVPGYHHNIPNDSKTSINSSIYSQGEAEPYAQLKSIETFGSSHSIPSQRKNEYQAAASLSNTVTSISSTRTPQNSSFIRTMQPNRNPLNPVPLESGTYDPNSRSKPPAKSNISHHRKSSSVSSIWSANSYRSVNMSKLKKSLDLKPGEGERSNYVVSIRRSAGTAYNDSPPGKWKLPIGILPVDNRIGYAANGRYLRLAGGVQGRNKKTSGVELKHGHLQPRLLAAEVDDGDESPVGLQSLGRSGTDLTIGTNKSSVGAVKSSDSSVNVTPSGSLLRKSSYGKAIDDLQSINTGGDSSSTLPSSKRAESVSSTSSPGSSSSNSLTDFNIGIGGYYQHPGYLHNDDEETSTEFETDFMGDGGNRNNDYNDYDTKPRLVLANPDNSDSD